MHDRSVAPAADNIITVPITLEFKADQQIGTATLDASKLPPNPNYVFSIGFRADKLTCAPGEVPRCEAEGPYNLGELGLVGDERYLGYLQQVGKAPAPAAFKQECDDADALLRLLGLDPERCRTEGGFINMGSVRSQLADKVSTGPFAAGPVGAAVDVLAERRRQIEAEGWTLKHDDEHHPGDLALAAASLCVDGTDFDVIDVEGERFEGWGLALKHRRNRRRQLVIAAALLLAEIERRDRAEEASHGG